MKNLEFYLEAAKKNHEIKSDAKLASALGISTTSVLQWRYGRSFPADETMVRLAALAGISKEQALLELSYWRADGEAKETYAGLIKRLGVLSAATMLIISLNKPVKAHELNQNINHSFSKEYTLSHKLKKLIKSYVIGFIRFLTITLLKYGCPFAVFRFNQRCKNVQC